MCVTSPTPSLNSFVLVPIVFLGVPLPLCSRDMGIAPGWTNMVPLPTNLFFSSTKKFLSHVSQEITRELDSRESVRQEEG